jgi:hypothetical protein
VASKPMNRIGNKNILVKAKKLLKYKVKPDEIAFKIIEK